MIRAILLVTIVTLAIHAATSTPTQDLDVITDFIKNTAQSTSLRPKREFGSLLIAVKNQFKLMIEDIAFQALKFTKSCVIQMKLNLLKKLQAYSLSDVATVIFDSISDAVAEIAPAGVLEEAEASPEVNVNMRPSFDYSDLYSLSTLFDAQRK